MTTKLRRPMSRAESLPDPPRRKDMQQFDHLISVHESLRPHFWASDDVLVAGRGYVIESVESVDDWGRELNPEFVVAFGVDPKAIIARNGYVISEVGKPPEFILDIAAWTSAPDEEAISLETYSAMGVSEYWRFDGSGKGYYPQPLAGYRLAGDSYRPIELTEKPDGEVRGYSAALALFLCRLPEDVLRFAKPAGGRYLPTMAELEREAGALEREARALEGEARALAERDLERAAREREAAARIEAEAEIARLRKMLGDA